MFYDPSARPELPDLTKPSPRALAYILRDKTLWPPGFEFHYGRCATCALQIAHLQWPEEIPSPSSWYVAGALDINILTAIRIFMCRPSKVLPGWFETGTPEAIAADLDMV